MHVKVICTKQELRNAIRTTSNPEQICKSLSEASVQWLNPLVVNLRDVITAYIPYHTPYTPKTGVSRPYTLPSDDGRR